MLCSSQKNVSNELIFERHKNGIKLTRPSSSSDESRMLNHLLAANLNIYFLDVNSNFCKQNEEHAKNIGCLSAREGIGRNIIHFATKESARLIRSNDMNIIKREEYKIIEEVVKKDVRSLYGEDFSGLSFKMPWYNEENKIVGVFGCTIVLGNHPLAESIATLRNLGLLTSDHSSLQLPYAPAKAPKMYFTKRQTEILRLMVRGKYSKEISNLLNLSQRTVQHYVDHVKDKLGVHSRSELIEKVFDDFR